MILLSLLFCVDNGARKKRLRKGHTPSARIIRCNGAESSSLSIAPIAAESPPSPHSPSRHSNRIAATYSQDPTLGESVDPLDGALNWAADIETGIPDRCSYLTPERIEEEEEKSGQEEGVTNRDSGITYTTSKKSLETQQELTAGELAPSLRD